MAALIKGRQPVREQSGGSRSARGVHKPQRPQLNMIILQNVIKRYRSKRGFLNVIDDVSTTFPRGVNVGVLGGNGAGKSTLLRLLGGAEYPTKGKVVRQGTVSWPIGFSGGFQRSLTGMDNIRFISRIYNKNVDKMAEYVYDFSKLGDRLEMPVGTYSSGMRAKLAFALSMAIDFDFYLIDELTAVGDASFKKKCQMEFAKRRERATVIIVSHSTNTVKAYCDMVMILNNGKLTPYDDIDEGIEIYESM